ncbi:phage tail terminator family protein [[Clostridium] colinum]|uniref:phage tail terminator family protein n=1 Tax=[Clostridium] colinum TaxID=36835 RepID=UPI002025A9A6|nr:hypothetical protein [[Clostridium] colinum]
MIASIIKAITYTIKSEFEDIDVNSTDIDAGYNLPCFFIKIDSIKTEKMSTKIDTLYIVLEIIYVCENEKENQTECFRVSEILKNILLEKPIRVGEDISFQIYEDSLDIGDDYVSLTCDIEMNLIKDIEENLDYMEDIIIK